MLQFVCLSSNYYIVDHYIGLNVIKYDKWLIYYSINNWIEIKYM